ncbi:MAG: S9 family peptidase, partial [Chitinophagaceae bacterium]
KQLFFNWNPTGAPADSMYYISGNNMVPVKAGPQLVRETVWANSVVYNSTRTAYAYAKNTDIYYHDLKTSTTKRIIASSDFEYAPQFSFNDQKLVYTRNQNLYAWDIKTGETEQLTRIQPGSSRQGGRDRADNDNEQEKWLRKDQLAWFEVLKQRKEKKEATEAYNKATKEKEMRSIGIDDKNMQSLNISPDGRFVSYRLFKSASGNKGSIVPDYVTESGFTTDLPARTKVGEQQGTYEFFVYDRLADTVFSLKPDSLPGIKDLPDYVQDYPKQLEERQKKNATRAVSWSSAGWSPNGKYLLLDIRSQDNKDRWLAVWDVAAQQLKTLDRERNEAWIGGPGNFNRGWLGAEKVWFQSEATGYSHLYTIDIPTAAKKQITSGAYEVQTAELSNDKKYFYITTNEVHPGEKHFYRLVIADGKKEKLTTLTGSNTAALSPDEKRFGLVYSYSNRPPELFMQDNKAGAKMMAITDKAQSAEFRSYNWKEPEVIS